MLKNFNKTRTRCPVVVYEEINAVFSERKRPKNDKKIPIFTVLCNFCQIIDRVRGLER